MKQTEQAAINLANAERDGIQDTLFSQHSGDESNVEAAEVAE